MGIFHNVLSSWTNEREDGVKVIHGLSIQEADQVVYSFLEDIGDDTVAISTRNVPYECAFCSGDDDRWMIFNGLEFVGFDSNIIGPYGKSDFYEWEVEEESYYDEYGNFHEEVGQYVDTSPNVDWSVFIDSEGGDTYYVRIAGETSEMELASARYIVEDENGEVLASTDTYAEAESVGGSKIIDTKEEE